MSDGVAQATAAAAVAAGGSIGVADWHLAQYDAQIL